jgi:hypothetical protein
VILPEHRLRELPIHLPSAAERCTNLLVGYV